MREDNHEKRMFYKFIFLLVVTGLIVIVWIWKWTADDPKEQDPKEMFETSSQQENMQEPVNIDEEKINAVLKDEGESKNRNEAKEIKKSKQKEVNKEEAN